MLMGGTALPAGDRAVQMCLADPIGHGGELPADVIALVERILAQRPKLGIPLAQEIPGCRPLIAQRAIRSGVLMTTLLGAQPIPLLDLPLQVALNWKLALQLAAIYGRPGLDHRSREMVGTVLWNLALRYVIQQVLKLAPVLGWVAQRGAQRRRHLGLGQRVGAVLPGGGAARGQGTGIRRQGTGGRRRWQSGKAEGRAAMAELRGTTAQWRQAAATRYAGAEGAVGRQNGSARQTTGQGYCR